MDQSAVLLARHRVILCHFDTYSTALLFVRWSHGSLLAPTALPSSAMVNTVAGVPPPWQSHEAMDTLCSPADIMGVLQAMGVETNSVKYIPAFAAWANSEHGPVRIHLCCYTTLDAPKHDIATLGGEFRHMSALRAADRQELLLLRQVFDLMMAGGG